MKRIVHDETGRMTEIPDDQPIPRRWAEIPQETILPAPDPLTPEALSRLRALCGPLLPDESAQDYCARLSVVARFVPALIEERDALQRQLAEARATAERRAG